MNQPTSENIILVTRESTGIAHVILNRPNSLNALNKPMLTRLAQAFRSLDQDDAVKVIILSGSGRAFCAGIDLRAAEEVFKGAVKDTDVDAIVQMERCRKPIVGAVSGFAATAGFELALGCDILVVSKGTVFIDSHSSEGNFPRSSIYVLQAWNIPSWGLSQKLSRIIGPNKARELAFTGVPLTAEEGEKLGVVNHLVEESELMTKAKEIAKAILTNNHEVVLGYKSVINEGLKLSLGDGLALEKGIAHRHYEAMPSEKFRKLEEFIAGRKTGNSKL